MTSTPATGPRLQRPLELLPPIVTCLVATSLIWASLLWPYSFAIAIVIYDAYWLYQSFSVAICGIVAYRRLRTWQATDWADRLRDLPHSRDVYHLLVIPTYEEPVEVLDATLRHVVEQDFPRDRIFVVLGFESRDPGASERARKLVNSFRGCFGALWTTFHPQVAGEVAGKSSNQAWAARIATQRLLAESKANVEYVTITTCDADSRLPSKYFSALTHLFLQQRRERIYQPAILFHANIWRVPPPSRVLNSLHSFWQMAKLVRTDKLVPQSTYSMPLALCMQAGYWDVDVIPEDSHMFFKLLLRPGNDVRVEPIYLPVVADAAEGDSMLATLRSQFEQELRWAWGVADIPYVLLQAARNRSRGAMRRWYRVIRYIGDHLNWPVGPILLTFGASAPRVFNPDFSVTPFGLLLPSLAGWILSCSILSLAVLVVIDWRLKPMPEVSRPDLMRALHLLEWVLMPATSLLFSALPGLIAHIRLLSGRYLEYKVTTKRIQPATYWAESMPHVQPVASLANED